VLVAAGGVRAAAPVGLLDFSEAERARIAAHGPWPPPPASDASNRVLALPAAQDFGRLLFGDPRLSADGRVACATCHQPTQAFQDGRATAMGRHAGIRNTPALLDVATQRWFGWGGAHDTLWAASLAPILDAREMGHSLGSLAAAARAVPAWQGRYREVFGAAMPDDDERLAVDLAKALAAYQATLVSPRTAFDAFRDALQSGDRRAAAAYPLAAQRGLRLFIGEARCAVCHAGPRFSNGEFGDIGVRFFVPGGGVDAGRHTGLTALKASRLNRLGPYNDAGSADPAAVATRHVVQEHRHFGEFKVPGLRQLPATAPYMHNGSLATLDDVLRHYDQLDEERLHADGERILRPLHLSAAQREDLLAFLRSLSR
jgi:cytochrome c peroxidase